MPAPGRRTALPARRARAAQSPGAEARALAAAHVQYPYMRVRYRPGRDRTAGARAARRRSRWARRAARRRPWRSCWPPRPRWRPGARRCARRCWRCCWTRWRPFCGWLAGELHAALLPLLTFIGRRGPPDARRVANVTDLRRLGAVRAGACRAAPMAALRARPAAPPRAGAPARESGRRAAAQASPCPAGPGRAAHGGGC